MQSNTQLIMNWDWAHLHQNQWLWLWEFHKSTGDEPECCKLETLPWDVATPLLEDTICMMMKLTRIKRASLWVNLSLCETWSSECSSVLSHPWRPAPGWLTPHMNFSGIRVHAQARSQLTASKAKLGLTPEEWEQIRSNGCVWSGPYEELLTGVHWKGKSRLNSIASK